MQKFINSNRVFLVGFLSTIALVLQQVVQAGPVSLKALGLALAVGVCSYVANEWKAKTASILGIIGSAASAIGMQLEHGHLSWVELLISILIGAIGVLSEGLKAPQNREYIPNTKP